MDAKKSNHPLSADYPSISKDATFVDGARLIAPSIAPAVQNDIQKAVQKDDKDGFQLALDGAYPLSNPVIDLENRSVYSVDMVRLEFQHESQQEVINAIDGQMVLCTCESYTSNRIGSYRFLWIFRYADGVDGGYHTVNKVTGELLDDGGNKDVVLKVGYGVVLKGGNVSNRGFVEFNPNKCERNGRRFLDMMEACGCLFSLKRFDIAIDYPVDRNLVRMMRDRRKYEFVVSSKGGATEYLGTRNAPGRVKVYDKSGEQGIEDAFITRVELTVNADWGLASILEHLPHCVDFSTKKLKGTLLLFANMVFDLLSDVDESGKHTLRSLETVPERYYGMLPKDRRYKVKKALKKAEKRLQYNETAIIKIVERAKSFESFEKVSTVEINKIKKPKWLVDLGA